MSAPPYLPLYIDDFEAATAHLTPAEDGIYNRLMRLCWRTPGCSVPAERPWLVRRLRVSDADFEAIVSPVLEEFFTTKNGRYVQVRLLREFALIEEKTKARKKAGQAGGRAKALKTNDPDPSNATDLPGDTRAFPEPEPEPKLDIEKKDSNESSENDLFGDDQKIIPIVKPKAPKGTRIPSDWQPSPSDIHFALTEGLTQQETSREADQFRDYWCSRSRDASRLDWSLTWKNRVREIANRKREALARRQSPGGGGSGIVDRASIIARRYGSDSL